MNKDEFIIALQKLGINATKDQLLKLDIYYNMLTEYNEHVNLTRIIEEKDVYLKHFYDSLTISKIIELKNQSVLDIGTGAGFPGIVLKIFYPNIKITLVDSLNKRIVFLNKVVKQLGLKGVTLVHDRAEDFAKTNREKYDVVTSRAVAELRILLEYSVPCLKVNGTFISMKGKADEELLNSKSALLVLNSKIIDIKEFQLPNNEGQRTLIKVVKLKETNVKYPRKFSEIKKNPL